MKWFQQYAGEWARETFPDATYESILNHLGEEVLELMEACEEQAGAVADEPDGGVEEGVEEEAADCLLLLLELAHEGGFDLFEAARRKHEENRRRDWGDPDECGVTHHIERKEV